VNKFSPFQSTFYPVFSANFQMDEIYSIRLRHWSDASIREDGVGRHNHNELFLDPLPGLTPNNHALQTSLVTKYDRVSPKGNSWWMMNDDDLIIDGSPLTSIHYQRIWANCFLLKGVSLDIFVRRQGAKHKRTYLALLRIAVSRDQPKRSEEP